MLGNEKKMCVSWSNKSYYNCKIQNISHMMLIVLPQCMGDNVLNVHGHISMGENRLPNQAYAIIFKVKNNGSC